MKRVTTRHMSSGNMCNPLTVRAGEGFAVAGEFETRKKQTDALWIS